MTNFTIQHPDKDGLVWLMSGEGSREGLRQQIARVMFDEEWGGQGVPEQWETDRDYFVRQADRILSLPGISTNYGINLGKQDDVAEILSQWLGSIDYLEDQ